MILTPIYITVDHLGRIPSASRPLCQGCTADGSLSTERAEYKIVGASGTFALCRRCTIHSIKSLAARFVMFDPSATRDLMDFFAAEAKKRPATRSKRSSKAPKALAVIEIPAKKLLAEPSETGRRRRDRR